MNFFKFFFFFKENLFGKGGKWSKEGRLGRQKIEREETWSNHRKIILTLYFLAKRSGGLDEEKALKY